MDRTNGISAGSRQEGLMSSDNSFQMCVSTPRPAQPGLIPLHIAQASAFLPNTLPVMSRRSVWASGGSRRVAARCQGAICCGRTGVFHSTDRERIIQALHKISFKTNTHKKCFLKLLMTTFCSWRFNIWFRQHRRVYPWLSRTRSSPANTFHGMINLFVSVRAESCPWLIEAHFQQGAHGPVEVTLGNWGKYLGEPNTHLSQR